MQALQAALDLYRTIGGRVGQVNLHWQLGIRAAKGGKLEEAEKLIASAVELGQAFAPEHPHVQHMASVLQGLRGQLEEQE